MKKSLLVLFVSFLLFSAAESQPASLSGYFPTGKVMEDLTIQSQILGYEVSYAIYLPPGYDESTQRYPVVYLLHGFSDDESAWIQFGEVAETADRGIANRDIPPMIIVMPDAKVTWYVNDKAGKNRYEDMAMREMIPYIDSHYRTRTGKQFRAVAGLSMGGYGSLMWSLHHPEMFVACAAYSPGVFTDEEIRKMPAEQYNELFGEIYGIKNDERITQHWQENSPVNLMNTLSPQDIEKVRLLYRHRGR